jgi:signal transduction histidine kinase
MPEIPITGFVLEALGGGALALMLTSFERRHSRAGVRDWSLGLWCKAVGLLASIAYHRAPGPPLQPLLTALAYVLGYWSSALVLLGTWSRWHDQELPRLRRRLLAALALLGLATTLGAPLAGSQALLVRAGPIIVLALVAYLAGGVFLLRDRAGRPSFGVRVLAFAFLGRAAEEGLFLGLVISRPAAGPAFLSADVLVQSELLLLILLGVGMVAWLLEEERESAVRLQATLQRQEALSAMGSLVGGVAHEVRNPLFGISATLDALEARGGSGRPSGSLLEVMREQVQRLHGLMKDLLDYGRPVKTSELERHRISEVVERAIRACSTASQQAGVRIELVGEAGESVVLIEEDRLVQALANVVQNAVEHTPRGGSVRVTVEAKTSGVHAGVSCAVHDSGPGFDPDHLPHVFEPFFTHRRGGTGLGLSIVHRIVEQHSGQVDAANDPGGGGVVTVWLPSGAPDPG